MPDTLLTEGSAVPDVGPARDPMVGRIVGAYRILARVGEGNGLSSYLAEHVHLDRQVLFKLFHPAREGGSVGTARRTIDQARDLSALKHDDVLPLVEIAECGDGFMYVVLELSGAQTLPAVLAERGPLSWPVVRALGRQIVGALRVADAAGLAATELTPEQIYLSAETDGERRARVDLVTPEALGWRVPSRPAAHVRAVGQLLYAMLAGREPAPAEHGLPDLVLNYPDLDIPSDADALVMRAVDPAPEKRWPDLAALYRELGGRDSTHSDGTTPRSPGARDVLPAAEFDDGDATFGRRVFSWPSRRALVAGAIGVGVAIVLAVIVLVSPNDSDPVALRPVNLPKFTTPIPAPPAVVIPPPLPSSEMDPPPGEDTPPSEAAEAQPAENAEAAPGVAPAPGAPDPSGARLPDSTIAAEPVALRPAAPVAEATLLPAPPAVSPSRPGAPITNVRSPSPTPASGAAPPSAAGARVASAPANAARAAAAAPANTARPAPPASAAPVKLALAAPESPQARPPAPASPAPADATPCAVSLGSIPWSDVWVDGRRAGFTPLTDFPVSCGAHDVLFKSADHGLERHIALNVRPGDKIKRIVDLAASKPVPSTTAAPRPACRLTLGSRPWSEVWIDGRRAGITPMVDYPIACGAHDLLFLSREANVQHRESITVQSTLKKVITLVEGTE